MFRSSVRARAMIQDTEGDVMTPHHPAAAAGGPTDYHAHGPQVFSPHQHGFSPYDFNGGTVAAVAGDDFVVVAADTRLSSGFEILSRNVTKLNPLTPHCVLANSGCKTDQDQLRSVLEIKTKVYQHNHRKTMTTPSVAQMLANTLYGRRFFPYYAFNVLAGLDAEGKGAVYSYDAIGSFERSKYSANGSGQAYVIPFLDNVVGLWNRNDEQGEIEKEEVVELLKHAFISCTERDIYTGDRLQIMVITASGIETSSFDLKKD